MSEESKDQIAEEVSETSSTENISAKERKPAGFAIFLQRALATYLDLIIIFAVYYVLELVLVKTIFKVTVLSFFIDLFSRPDGFVKTISGLSVVLSLIWIIYLILTFFLEASAKGAGIGKRILDIYVLDEHLKPITYSKSLIRSFSKLLSVSVFGLGFLIYFFNQKKQSLHDILARTVVARKEEVDYNRLVLTSVFCFLSTLVFAIILRFIITDPPKNKELPKVAVKLIRPILKREIAKLKFDSESSESSVALWHHDSNNNFIEIGFFSRELTQQELLEIRTAKSLQQKAPYIIVTFELQHVADSLNIATVTKYGVSFIRSKEMYFPGKAERADFFYVPEVTENLQLARLSGRLAEGEKISGYLNNAEKKAIAEVDFDAAWDIEFNIPLLDLEKGIADLASSSASGENENSVQSGCVIGADQSKIDGVDTVALYYPEEGDVAVGIFSEPLTQAEKEEFRKKKSIWLNLNGKAANFVVFFDLKKESQSFTRESLLEYSTNFIKDNYGRLDFPSSSGRAQFSFKDIDFTAEEIHSLKGTLSDGSDISFSIKKNKESKLSGIRFSWNCNLESKLMRVEN